MLRETVLAGFLALHDEPSYLEIGVHSGHTFHPLKAAFKVAVDPDFQFELPSPSVTSSVEYHQVTSDRYFGTIADPARKFDVIYVDGLHTAEQTLRDVLNAVEWLHDDGVIVVDDVIPSSYAASLPDFDDFDRVRKAIAVESGGHAWMGDVYRVVFFVQAFMQGWDYRVVEENHGQLVMWRSRRPAVAHPERTLEWTGRVDMVTMIKSFDDMQRTPYAEILAAYEAAMERRRAAISRPTGPRAFKPFLTPDPVEP